MDLGPQRGPGAEPLAFLGLDLSAAPEFPALLEEREPNLATRGFFAPREAVELSPPVHDAVAYSTCYMCACRCGIKVHLLNGRIRYIEGNRDHPCLLYTSPSPRDRQKSRMPSSA